MIEFTPSQLVGALVVFLVATFAVLLWPKKKKPTPDYSLGRRSDLGYSGKYLRRHKPGVNINSHINTLFGAPRKFLFPSAIITQEKRFPDVSFWQGAIDWDIMAEKTDAVIIRAGQNTWIDTQFVTNWSEAKRVGMQRGVYFFYDDRVSPGAQAELLISLIKDDLPEMEVWVDWENSYGGGFKGLTQVCAMMGAIERALPTATVGIYTGYYWFRENTNPITNVLQYNYLKYNPLWLAWYGNADAVLIPQPWSTLTHWQFGTPAVGEEYGVQTHEIDLNFFNGSAAEFDLRYGGQVTPPPEPEPGETMRYEVIWPSGATRRPLPTTLSTRLELLPVNTVIEVMADGIPDQTYPADASRRWVKFTDGTHAASDYPDGAGPQARMVKMGEPEPDVLIPDYLLAHYANGTEKKYLPE